MPSRGLFGTSALLAALTCAGCGDERPVRVGVLLPLSGDAAHGYQEPLSWARDELNRAGGVRGRPIELVYEDIGDISTDDLDAPRRVWDKALRFLNDPEMDVVIGTDDDATTLGITPSFIKAQKLLITPIASSADLTRAVGTSPFIRRTIANDAAQAELLVLHAQRTGASTISVLATATRSGSTFFEWIPFHAEEAGLQVNDARRIAAGEDDCSDALLEVVAHGAPDVLYLIPENTAQAECMIRSARELMPDSRLFLSDPKRLTGLFEALGDVADGVEGISLEAPLAPAVGPSFEKSYRSKFGHAPTPFAANLFDALTLTGYTLSLTNGAAGPAVASAFDQIVRAKGEATSWDGDGIQRTLELIADGAGLPDVSGATGALSYSELRPLELTSSTFAVWQAQGGQQQFERVESGSKTLLYPDNFFTLDAQGDPFAKAPSSALRSTVTEEDTGYVPAERKGAWAFVAAMSSTMNNYRHQADALAVYQMLKQRGFDDDHIVLVLADDIADASTNPDPGTVFNIASGPNLRTEDVKVDYRLRDITPKAMLDILQGNQTETTPTVVASTANDDVFVFWVGHGGDTGVLVGDTARDGEAPRGNFITPFAFAAAIRAKFAAKGFRQMVVALESCHSGGMGVALDTPGVALMTSATPYENSFATNFNPATSIWNADAFSYSLSNHIAASPDSSISELYESTYLDLRGSHPRLFNAGRFGKIDSVSVGSILSP